MAAAMNIIHNIRRARRRQGGAHQRRHYNQPGAQKMLQEPLQSSESNGGSKNKQASWKLAVKEGKQNESLKLVPFPPSGPRCLSPATGSLNRSCAGGTPAARTSKQVGSWKWRKEQNKSLKLVSSQFRTRRLAICLLRARPSFRAKVF